MRVALFVTAVVLLAFASGRLTHRLAAPDDLWSPSWWELAIEILCVVCLFMVLKSRQDES